MKPSTPASPAGGQERLAEGQVDQHAAEGADGAGDADHARRTSGGRASSAPRRARRRRCVRCLAPEDRRDHLVRRAVADAAEDEQRDEPDQVTAAATRCCDASSTMRRADRHRDEVPERDPGAAEPVGQPAADRADQRAEQRAEEGQVGGLDRGAEVGRELHLQHLAEGEAEADERAERADVEQRHDPGVRVPGGVAHAPASSLRACDRLSMSSAAAERGQHDQRDVDAGHDARVRRRRRWPARAGRPAAPRPRRGCRRRR